MSPHLSARNSLVLAFFVSATSAVAAPSGGPYGPVDTNYAVPKAPHVYYVAPDGKATAAGTVLAAPTTIETAIAKAKTGDAVILRGGVYRTGGLPFNQKLIIPPYGREHPVLTGTEIPTGGQPAGTNVWKTAWTRLFPATPMAWWRREKEEAKTPLHRFNNDMVFVDGRFLQSAGSVAELNENNYYIDYAAKEVYVGVDPSRHTIEVTAHDGALIRTAQNVNGMVNDHQGPVIRGLTITQYARRRLEVEGKKQFGPNDEPTDEPVGLADPATFGKEVIGTVLENNTIAYCSRVGGWFRGDKAQIRNNLFTDTSTEGLYVIGSSDVVIERNIVRRNNIEQLTGYYPGAVKIFNQTRRVIMRDNLVIDNPNSNAVWFDVGNRDAVFVNNYIADALVGFFFEISKGATVAGNVFVRNGDGARALNSSGVKMYNNTFIDNPARFERTERSAVGDHFAWHPSTGPDVDERVGHAFVNNLVLASETYRDPLLRVMQADVLCGKVTSMPLAQIDGNVYVRAAATPGPLALWSPVASTGCAIEPASLDALRQAVPGAETHSRQIDAAARAVIKNPEMMRFEPQAAFRGALKTAVKTPAAVLKLMGWKKGGGVGAYPAGK